MRRIEAHFERLSREGRRALVPFITAGDPSPDTTLDTMRALVGAGADVIELGMPFSDPMADGPVIQRASERAIAGGMDLAGVLEIVRRFRDRDAATSVVLMGYLNPMEVYGASAFAADAARAGVDGVLTVDLPPEERTELHDALPRHELDQIFLVSPTTTDERVRLISGRATGFLYYVSLKGITGAAHLNVGTVESNVRRVKATTGLPVAVGFGIRDAQSAAAIAAVADAVVVGTALVQRVEDLVGEPAAIPKAVSALVAEMRSAMDGAT